MEEKNTRWASRITFIFAASAAAIGLGNIWRFPYVTGQNGGGAFVILYLLCVVILGIPLLVAEIAMGRIERKNPAKTMAALARKSNKTALWGLAGGLTVLAGYLILTYYVVIVGWVLDYVGRAALGQFTKATQESSMQCFHNLQHSFFEMLAMTTVVLVATYMINTLGIKRGLERAVMLMFPALLFLMLVLLGYSMSTGWFDDALAYLFKPDFSKITTDTVLLALGQAFFSLNIAMGVTMMFSAYLPEGIPTFSSAIAIAIADTGFALLAGLIIFPIVFAFNLQPGAGPSLIFETLPIAFGQMPFGSLIASVFFIMLFFAAFSSVIAVLEPSVSFLMETFHITRKRAVAIGCLVLWLLSLGCIGSFYAPYYFSAWGISFFQAIDFITASVMLPLGGILIALFAGWFLSKQLLKDGLNWNVDSRWYKIWRMILRYLAPLAILLILFTSLR